MNDFPFRWFYFLPRAFLTTGGWARAGRVADSLVVLSPAGKIGRPDNRRDNWAGRRRARGRLTQERMLKTDLKPRHRTGLAGKDQLQMFHGLQQRIGLATGGRFQLAGQPGAHGIQALAQAGEQMISRLQCKQPGQRLRRRFDGSTGEPLAEQLPQERRADRVAREHLGQEEGKRASAAAALAAIGTKDPLAPGQATVGGGGIVAVE
jgi:hypothetical protein